MRVVFDTNVLISACWTPTGLEAKAVDLVHRGIVTPCISDHVWAEYRDVLLRDKFAALRPAAQRTLRLMEARAHRVHSVQTICAASDEDDNRFLECAAAAGAAYLVTGNLKHYPSSWEMTAIVNAREFLDRCLRHYAQP